MKDAIVAKVATQAADYYQDAYRLAASPMVKNMWDKVITSDQNYHLGLVPLLFDLLQILRFSCLTVHLSKGSSIKDVNTFLPVFSPLPPPVHACPLFA